MSPEKFKDSPESDLNFIRETELTLGLPGDSRKLKPSSSVKRGRSDTVDLSIGGSSSISSEQNGVGTQNIISTATKPPAKEELVGWPPVRSYRKKVVKYVKVALDGAPYLRKVDLEFFHSYHQLVASFDHIFTCLTICNVHNGTMKLMDTSNGTEYVPTYEDKDGDWMLLGDVPWKMFVESCKRLRLMKSSEALGLARRTPSKCSRTS